MDIKSTRHTLDAEMLDPYFIHMANVMTKLSPVCGLEDKRIPAEIIEKIELDTAKKMDEAA